MKLLKYFAIMALVSVSGLAFAQKANTSEPNVSVSMDSGVISLKINFDVTDPTVSSEDALKKALYAALKSLGQETFTGKALGATVAAMNSAMSDPNFPAKGNVELNIQIRQPSADVIDTSLVAKLGGETFKVDTRSVSDPSSGNISTTGNVAVTKADGSSVTSGVNVTTDAAGKVIGNVGSNTVAEQTPAAEAASEMTTSPESKEVASGESNPTPLPDPTVVISEDK